MSQAPIRSRAGRADVVAAARRWLGIPFRHQGRGREGIDCAGLAIKIAHELGIAEGDFQTYSRTPDGQTLQALCDQTMDRIEVARIAPGDVLLFRGDGHPRHLAIVGDYFAGGLSMIHAYTRDGTHGSVVENRLAEGWRARIVAAYRLPGLL